MRITKKIVKFSEIPENSKFRSISADTMDYKVNIYLRQRWVDKRLQHNSRGFGHI